MRIAVLGAAQSWYFRDLCRAAAGRCELLSVPFTRMHASLGGDTVIGSAVIGSAVIGSEVIGSAEGHDLRAADAVLVRTMPPGSLEQVVFRMDALARLEAAGVPVINPSKAIEAAVDKYLASAKLVAAGLAHPPTIVCQSADDAMRAFATLGGDVVVKPLFGSEGRGITRVSDEAIALRVFRTLAPLGAVLYLQQFVAHEGCDLRVLVIGERLLGMRRSSSVDWRTNVSRGATTAPVEVTPHIADLARRAAAAVGASVAGVDLLPGRDGSLYVIEVNAVPGWRALARTLDVDVAALVLDYVGELARQRPASRDG